MYEFRTITPRIEKFRNAVRDRVVEIENERSLIVTEEYKKYKYYPPILRKPLITKAICEQMTVRVEDNEIFVGQVGKYGFDEENSITSSCLFPEIGGSAWFYNAFDEGRFVDDGTGRLWYAGDFAEKVFITKEEAEIAMTYREFWEEHSFGSSYNAWHPDGFSEFVDLRSHEYYNENIVVGASGHLTPGYHNIISTGYSAIRKKAQDFLDEHKGDFMGRDVEKYMFYQSITVICDGIITLHKRYAKACSDKAAACADPARKAELEMMADGLEWISEKPPRTFWEALQMVLLYKLLIIIDSSMAGIAFGRVDQYSWPFLEKELEAGSMTMDRAQEIIDYFVLKSSNFFNARDPIGALNVGAGNTFQHVTLGGVFPGTGEDATNPVTYLFLETMARLYLHDPLTSLRVHKDTPKELWECAIAVTERVGGMPLFQNDDVIIPGLMKRLDFSLEDARDYSIIGCQEIVGSGNDYPEASGTNHPSAVWYGSTLVTAMNNGVNPLYNVDSGVRTGYLYEMESIDEVRTAMKKMMRWTLRWSASMNNFAQWVGRWECYHAILSLAMDDCMEKGMDCHQGGARYNSFGSTATGLATIADSLATIKYMCFDKKICTTRELFDAYMADWEGYDDLRQRILRDVPHYGNDDPYVDDEMAWAANTYIELCDEVSSLRTDKYKPGMYTGSAHIDQGLKTWATPDGRKKGQPVADAASPVQGRDVNGPIAVLNSANCFDQGCMQNGMCLNLKLHPTALQGDGREKLAMMTQSYFERGGAEVQYNIVGSETLRAAQKEPEKYRDLIVRVAGFSAYFTELADNLQNDLISRQDHMLG